MAGRFYRNPPQLTIGGRRLDLERNTTREAYRPRETRRELMASAKGERKCIQRWCHGGVRATGSVVTGELRARAGGGRSWGAGGGAGAARRRRWRSGRRRQEGFGGGAFGVRRPLRFLAYKLELDERQVARAGQHPGRAQDRARPGRGRPAAVAVGVRRRGQRSTRSTTRAPKQAANQRVDDRRAASRRGDRRARAAAHAARQGPARAPGVPDPHRRPDAVAADGPLTLTLSLWERHRADLCPSPLGAGLA